MSNKDTRIVLEHQHNDFTYDKSKSKLDIKFNRIAFIFFIFFIYFIIYSIHLMHLGSRKSNNEVNSSTNNLSQCSL